MNHNHCGGGGCRNHLSRRRRRKSGRRRVVILFVEYTDTDDDDGISISSSRRSISINEIPKREIGVGIDLGTTNSAVAYWDERSGRPNLVTIPHNGRTMPSIVALQFHSSSSNRNNHHQCSESYTPIVGKLALLTENNNDHNDDHHHHYDHSSSINHHHNNNNSHNKSDRMIYRNVKRIIGTGGKVLSVSSSMSSSSSTTITTKREDHPATFLVPHVQISPTGKTYSKNNLMNQLYDSIHHPTLLLLRQPQLPSQPHSTSSTISSSNNNHNDTGSDTDLNHVDDGKNNSKNYIRPEVISSYIIQALKNVTEQQLDNVIVTRAVIGVPAYFNDAQRNATIMAAQLAGIPKIKLLREPEAAALAYGFIPPTSEPSSSSIQNNKNKKKDNNIDDDELVLVFDLGGGTYDVSILYTSRQDQIMEIIATSGNTELGGSTFDAKIALFLQQQIRNYQKNTTGILETTIPQDSSTGGSSGISYHSTKKKNRNVPNSILVLAAEAIRIHLSNNRIAHLFLPVNDIDDWSTKIAQQPASVIASSKTQNDTSLFASNTTHLYLPFTRKEMESICADEIQALLRPIREVAIMANAFLPGDSSPSIVAAAALLDDEEADGDDADFDGSSNKQLPQQQKPQTNNAGINFYSDTEDLENDINILQTMASTKKSQQLGRKRARDVAKDERKYRQEKKNIAMSTPQWRGDRSRTVSSSATMKNPKVRDGISGRPISRIVLVGGATRMPCIGRLLTVVTGIVPQRTVHPDEAVALGCAVQVGIYDGQPNMGTVLTPMQAAILRATTTATSTTSMKLFNNLRSNDDGNFNDADDDDEFDDGIVY
jgi:molecular chaperone DnaK (HSP70)